jgi:hypothetical protein
VILEVVVFYALSPVVLEDVVVYALSPENWAIFMQAQMVGGPAWQFLTVFLV